MGSMVGIVYGNTDRKIHSIVKYDDSPPLISPTETLVQMVRSTYDTYSSERDIAVSLGLV